MDSRTLSKFVNGYKFVSVLQREQDSLSVIPSHRTTGGWRGITGHLTEEVSFLLPVTQKAFYEALMKAFDVAS